LSEAEADAMVEAAVACGAGGDEELQGSGQHHQQQQQRRQRRVWIDSYAALLAGV
jgi:hypothetical protein